MEKPQTATVASGSYIVLHSKRHTTYTVEGADRLDTPRRVFVYPNGVQAILEAKKAGTAVVKLAYSGPAANNWSGYELSDKAVFTGVTAQWVVPTIQPGSPQGMSSTWVGIDGDGNNTVLQAGTEQDNTPWYAPLSGAV